MRRIVAMSMMLTAALAFAAGCGSHCEKSGAKVDEATQATPEGVPEKLEQDNEPLDVESDETPEGVVNGFFRTFFRGDSDGAFALLTKRAQEAQSENFLAQSSNTIRWRVIEKTKPTSHGRVYVWVEVEDYAESGEVQRDLLTFVTSDDEGEWRVAGFNVGEVAVDFEESVIVAQEAPVAPEVERTAIRVDETKTRR
ncbi:MAG: hypothetical protein IJL92_09050 [Thermoguttaceae bacterium]|nr:hypothetical protein [Thermoguttaceae bacterium]